MKNKRIIVLGIALILIAVVAGAAFAGSVSGVSWWSERGHDGSPGVRFQNNNSHYVRVIFTDARSGQDLGIWTFPPRSRSHWINVPISEVRGVRVTPL